MGKLEVPEGLEYVLWKTRWRLDSLEQWGKELQRELEVELEMEPEVVQTWKAPVGGLEKALWSVACAVEGLASGQAMIQKELVKLRKYLCHSEEHFELITDNVKSMVDSVEMFTCGD